MLLEFARKQKYLPRDFAVMDEVDQSEEGDFDIESFTAEEITKILAAARWGWREGAGPTGADWSGTKWKAGESGGPGRTVRAFPIRLGN